MERVEAFIAKLRSLTRRARARPERASILLPFLIIAIGLGALAWRSYNLSIDMEHGASVLASQYAGYAAEITARHVDAAVRTEMGRASDQWQLMERRSGDPTGSALREWIAQHNWIVSAIYVPDYDPAGSIFFAEPPPPPGAVRIHREFFSSSGSVRYIYDPVRLLATVRGALRQKPIVQPGTFRQQQAEVSVIASGREGLQKLENGFAFTSLLSPPLEKYGVRATVRTLGGGRGWENQRVVSAWVSLLALALTGVGLFLALRGLQKESETMKLRGALIANVSHELRTPLSMIRLGAETLKRGRLKDKERQDIEEQMLREVLLLSHLVENVLDVARIQNRSTKALAFTPVAPQDLIRNLITTYESWIRSKGFTVAVQLDDAVGDQMWDRDAVSRALLNLIDNAIKYSGDEKAIDVVLRQTAEDVVIEVRDRGLGIDAKEMTRIFDPYYRAKFSDTTTRRGAGLGLTLVQQIVTSHGGRVEVESAPGSGSTFRLIFPRIAGEAGFVPHLANPHQAF